MKLKNLLISTLIFTTLAVQTTLAKPASIITIDYNNFNPYFNYKEIEFIVKLFKNKSNGLYFIQTKQGIIISNQAFYTYSAYCYNNYLAIYSVNRFNPFNPISIDIYNRTNSSKVEESSLSTEYLSKFEAEYSRLQKVL